MKEKRKLKRRHLIFYLRVYDKNTGQLVGRLVDITSEGIMLNSENPIPTDTVFQLQMFLPEEFDKERLDFDAKSIWCKPDVNRDLFVTGLKLLNVANRDTEIIENLIDEYGFQD